MSDVPEKPESKEPVDAIQSESPDEVATPEAETPPGMLPLVAPFFGKNAFWIAAVPFLIYFIGTAFGGYLEKTRKTQPAHDIRGMSRSLLDNFVKSLENELPEEQANAIIEKYDLDGVGDALDDESSKVEVLVQKCQKLLDGEEFDDEALGVKLALQKLRAFVEEFLHIHAFWEDDELNKIRPSYMEFAKKHMPESDQELKYNESFYPTLYSIACLAAFAAMVFVLPVYFKRVPFRVSFLAVALGVIGVVLWVGIWWLNKEFGFGNTASRAAFNPLEELKDTPTWMWTFLGIRLLGMVIVVPVVEEFFLRGFLMRYCEDIDWDEIPIGEATWRGWAGILAYAAFSHVEVVAALVWFGMVTWMYLKTKNIWDCVVTHAITNGLLAAFVLWTGFSNPTAATWALW